MYHPSRGGVRGGRDQFNWDDVKADKHRENYLGHSVKAPVGRWQKGKDLLWYTKEHGGDGPSKEEIKRIQEEEEDAMKEMLGLAPRKNKRPRVNQLEKREVDELLKKGKTAEELTPSYAEGERIQGLGFAPAPGQTGGQAGGKRPVQVPRDDNVSLSSSQFEHLTPSKDIERGLAQEVAASLTDLEVVAGDKSGRDIGAVSSEDEAASKRKKKEEKRKAKGLRKEAKRKALKDESGHRSKEARRKSSHLERRRRQEKEGTSSDSETGHRSKEGRKKSSHLERTEEKSKRRHEKENSSSDSQLQERRDVTVKRRHDSDESDSSAGERARINYRKMDSRAADLRNRTSHEKVERRRVDPDRWILHTRDRRAEKVERRRGEPGSSSDGDHYRHHTRDRRAESPLRKHEKHRLQDVHYKRRVERRYSSSDDSTVIRRHNREEKELDPPIRRHQKQTRHDSGDEV